MAHLAPVVIADWEELTKLPEFNGAAPTVEEPARAGMQATVRRVPPLSETNGRAHEETPPAVQHAEAERPPQEERRNAATRQPPRRRRFSGDEVAAAAERLGRFRVTELAAELGASRDTTKQHISRAERRGLVRKAGREPGGGPNVYEWAGEPEPQPTAPCRHDVGQSDEPSSPRADGGDPLRAALAEIEQRMRPLQEARQALEQLVSA